MYTFFLADYSFSLKLYLLFPTVSAASRVQGTIVFSWTIAVTGPLRQSFLWILAIANVQIG